MTRRTLVSVLVALFFLSIMGTSAAGARGIAMAGEVKTAGIAILCICGAVLAYAIYEYRRKQHVFVLEDSFAIERRFREVRRRTRPMGTFQDKTSMDRILFAVFTHENKSQGVSTPFLLTQNN